MSAHERSTKSNTTIQTATGVSSTLLASSLLRQGRVGGLLLIPVSVAQGVSAIFVKESAGQETKVLGYKVAAGASGALVAMGYFMTRGIGATTMQKAMGYGLAAIGTTSMIGNGVLLAEMDNE